MRYTVSAVGARLMLGRARSAPCSRRRRPRRLCPDTVARDARAPVSDSRVGGRGGPPHAFGGVARQALRVHPRADHDLRGRRRQGDRSREALAKARGRHPGCRAAHASRRRPHGPFRGGRGDRAAVDASPPLPHESEAERTTRAARTRYRPPSAAQGGYARQAARGAALVGAICVTPISASVSRTALTAWRISSGPIAPMQPTRNVSTCVSLPG